MFHPKAGISVSLLLNSPNGNANHCALMVPTCIQACMVSPDTPESKTQSMEKKGVQPMIGVLVKTKSGKELSLFLPLRLS